MKATQFFALPEIPHFVDFGQPKLPAIQNDRRRRTRFAIEYGNGLASVGQRFDPDLRRPLLPDAMSLHGRRVLVDSNRFRVLQCFERLRGHVRQIVAAGRSSSIRCRIGDAL